MGARPPRKVWEFERGIMAARSSGRSHRWVVERKLPSQDSESTSLGRHGNEFSTRAKWRFFENQSVGGLVYLDTAVVVIDGMTSHKKFKGAAA